MAYQHFHPRRARAHRARGTVIALFMVLIGILVTGILMTMAMSAGKQSAIASLTLKRDQAFYAAEAGIQNAFWKYQYGSWAANAYPPFTGSAGNASYSVSVVGTDGFGSILIQSTGTIAGSPTPVSTTISGTIGGKYALPTIQLGAGYNAGGGGHITGNLMAVGAVSHNGNMDVAAGNIYSASTIDSNISLDTGYQRYPNFAVPAPPDVTAIANSLKNDSTAVTISTPGTLDFRSSSKGILVYTGNITNWKNPTIYGDGTLVVFGSVSTKSMTSLAGHNVNIVCVGDFAAGPGSKFDLTGSLYVSGNLSSQSQFAVEGIILCNDSMTTQGQGADVARMPPPWFDPRLAAGIGGTVVSKFTGPIF